MSLSGPNDAKPAEFLLTAPSFNFADPNTKHDAILVVEGTKFHVLSGLLVAWSEYFEGLFNSGLKVDKSNEINIEEVSADEFKQFLEYIYPTRIKLSEKNVFTLIAMAHRFLVPSIMVECRDFIRENFDTLDVFDVLEASIKYEIKELKSRIGSIIYGSSMKKEGKDNICNECEYAYWDIDFCIHQFESRGPDILINSFIYKNSDRICTLSVEAQSFVIKASVGIYKREKGERDETD